MACERLRGRTRRRGALLGTLACGGEGPADRRAPGHAEPRARPDRAGQHVVAGPGAASHAGQPDAGRHALPTGTLSAAGNWGYTAPDGRRFALTGTSYGLSIVEVTDPVASAQRGRRAGPGQLLAGGEDLRPRMPTSPRRRATGSTSWTCATPTGPGWCARGTRPSRPPTACGSTWRGRSCSPTARATRPGASQGMRVLDLSRNPEDPADLGGFTDFYIHDSYSEGNRLYAAAINGGFLAILDTSNPRAAAGAEPVLHRRALHAQRLARPATGATSSRPTSGPAARSRSGTCSTPSSRARSPNTSPPRARSRTT